MKLYTPPLPLSGGGGGVGQLLTLTWDGSDPFEIPCIVKPDFDIGVGGTAIGIISIGTNFPTNVLNYGSGAVSDGDYAADMVIAAGGQIQHLWIRSIWTEDIGLWMPFDYNGEPLPIQWGNNESNVFGTLNPDGTITVGQGLVAPPANYILDLNSAVYGAFGTRGPTGPLNGLSTGQDDSGVFNTAVSAPATTYGSGTLLTINNIIVFNVPVATDAYDIGVEILVVSLDGSNSLLLLGGGSVVANAGSYQLNLETDFGVSTTVGEDLSWSGDGDGTIQSAAGGVYSIFVRLTLGWD